MTEREVKRSNEAARGAADEEAARRDAADEGARRDGAESGAGAPEPGAGAAESEAGAAESGAGAPEAGAEAAEPEAETAPETEVAEPGEPRDPAGAGAGGDTGRSEAEFDEERSAAELRAALDDAERAAEEYLDHLRRERAEFENFRRRSTRERMEALDRGAENLTANLLGVLDNFDYTLDAARQSEDDQLAKGIEMVHTELVKVLTDAGLEEIPGVGQPFDPAVHEAMLQVEAADELGEEVGDPVVVEVLRPGYKFKGRVLRPAAVKVAR